MVWIGLILLAPALGSVDIYGDGEVRSEYLVQEQRQAGVVTPFAVFVRSLSSELRGDASSETVNLAAMPLVSVDAPSLKLGYGVHAEQTFGASKAFLGRRNCATVMMSRLLQISLPPF